jgi:16S rRNA processing protein RimM
LSALRLLVVEGNVAEARARHVATAGAEMSTSYSTVLKSLAPEAEIDISFPADGASEANWQLTLDGENREVQVEAAQASGKRLIAKIAGIDDRDAAAELIGAMIEVPRSELPPLAPDEFYWADLEGLAVINRAGERLGTVSRVMATGANDVLILDGSAARMIPFVANGIVLRVDLAAGEIVVDWDQSYWE